MAATDDEPPEREDEEETSARIWVPHTDCAKLIGKGGRTMRDVELRSRAKLKVQRENEMNQETQERYIDIIGTKKEQAAAMQLLLPLATSCRDDEGQVLKERRSSAPGADGASATEAALPPLVIEVLPDEVGRVLGRKGETVSRIEQEAGVRIDLDKATARVEILAGSKAQQDQALELLLAEVSYAKSLHTGEDGVNADAENGTSDGKVLKKVEKEQAQPPLKFWVKDSEAGRVIGKGGETVREVMVRTSTEVKVQKSDDLPPGCYEREILIHGDQEKQEQALAQILDLVTWAKDANGILKEPAKEAPKEPAKELTKDEGAVTRRLPSVPLSDLHRHHVRKKRHGERRRRRRGADGTGAGLAASAASGAPAPAGAPSAASPARGAREFAGSRGGGSRRSGLWVCANCGGDHRTKECPHDQGLLGMGMQIGMQMGMQQAFMMPPAGGMVPPPMALAAAAAAAGLPTPMPMMPGVPGLGPLMPPLLGGMPPMAGLPMFAAGRGRRRRRRLRHEEVSSSYSPSFDSYSSDFGCRWDPCQRRPVSHTPDDSRRHWSPPISRSRSRSDGASAPPEAGGDVASAASDVAERRLAAAPRRRHRRRDEPAGWKRRGHDAKDAGDNHVSASAPPPVQPASAPAKQINVDDL